MKSPKSNQQRTTTITVATVLAVAVIFGGFGVYSMVRSSALPKPQTATATFPSKVAGEQGTAVGPYAVSVHGAQWVAGPDGSLYLVVNVAVSNESGQVQQFSPLLQTYVVDSNGTRHDYTADTDTSPMGGPINPAATANGTLSFKLDQQSVLPTLYFAAEAGAIGTAIVLN